jgi:hypothetical protein
MSALPGRHQLVPLLSKAMDRVGLDDKPCGHRNRDRDRSARLHHFPAGCLGRLPAGYFGCWPTDMTYAVACQISSSVSCVYRKPHPS